MVRSLKCLILLCLFQTSNKYKVIETNLCKCGTYSLEITLQNISTKKTFSEVWNVKNGNIKKGDIVEVKMNKLDTTFTFKGNLYEMCKNSDCFEPIISKN